jgi:hypothetical protein
MECGKIYDMTGKIRARIALDLTLAKVLLFVKDFKSKGGIFLNLW